MLWARSQEKESDLSVPLKEIRFLIPWKEVWFIQFLETRKMKIQPLWCSSTKRNKVSVISWKEIKFHQFLRKRCGSLGPFIQMKFL